MTNADCTAAKVCRKYGHVFYGASCDQCTKLYRAAYYIKNAEKVKARSNAWKSANPEKRTATGSSYYEKNKEEIRRKQAVYCDANKEKSKARSAAYYLENKEKIKANANIYYKENTEKVLANVSAYRLANPEKTKAMSAASRAKKPEKALACSARYRAADPVKHNARSAAWKAKNPEKLRIYTQNRRARKLSAGSGLTQGIESRLLKLQRGKCACCQLPLGDDYHLDHIMPLALGGANEDWNMQLLRAKCNLQKSSKHPIDFMQSRGFLL